MRSVNVEGKWYWVVPIELPIELVINFFTLGIMQKFITMLIAQYTCSISDGASHWLECLLGNFIFTQNTAR